MGDEDGVGPLEGLLHAHGAVGALAHVVGRVERVLDADHARPVAVGHVLKQTHSRFQNFTRDGNLSLRMC